MRFWMIFGAVLTAMHLLIWTQARRQLHLPPWLSALALVVSLAMALSSASLRIVPEDWPQPLTIAVWWAVYLWLALAMYLFVYQLACLVLEGGCALMGLRLAAAFRSPWCFAAGVACAGLVVAHGFQEASEVRLLAREINSPKVDRPLRIVAVSDIHLGALNLNGRLRVLAARINDLKPDIVAFVGDIVNDHPQWLGQEAEVLATIKAPLKVGVFGNHERYVGDWVSAEIYARSGIVLLRNQTLDLPGHNVRVLGVDDPGVHQGVPEILADSIRALAAGVDPRDFSLLLLHRPQGWKEAAAPLGLDLTVSGHTHGGQVFPFTLVVRSAYEFFKGFYERDGRVLAVSSGAGYWGPPVRVLAPPDMVLVDVKPAR